MTNPENPTRDHTTGGNRHRVLLVDDEENILDSYGRILRRQWDLVTANSGAAGLEALEKQGPFAVIVSDFNMPRMDGIKFLAKAWELAPETVRMMLTGEGDFHIATKAVNEGNIFRFLTKPCPQDQLIKALEAGVAQYHLIQVEKENRRLEREAREHEVQVASEIQRKLLLETPPADLQGAEVAVIMTPSRQVDGDFIDFFQYSPTCFDVFIGDVMGKGIQAALIGAGTKSRFSRVLNRLLNSAAARGALPAPGQVLDQINRDMGPHLLELGSFITVCYARFDLATRRVTIVNGGHPPLLHYVAANDACEELEISSAPLGIQEVGTPYAEHVLELAPGDIVMIYSDGLMDGRNPQGEFFETARIAAGVADAHALAPAPMLAGILSTYRDFVQTDSFSDDLSCLAVKIAPPR